MFSNEIKFRFGLGLFWRHFSVANLKMIASKIDAYAAIGNGWHPFFCSVLNSWVNSWMKLTLLQLSKLYWVLTELIKLLTHAILCSDDYYSVFAIGSIGVIFYSKIGWKFISKGPEEVKPINLLAQNLKCSIESS